MRARMDIIVIAGLSLSIAVIVGGMWFWLTSILPKSGSWEQVAGESTALESSPDQDVIGDREETRDQCSEFTDTKDKDNCYNRLAVQQGREDLCKSLSFDRQDLCLRNVAKQKQDHTVCLAIRKDLDRSVCLREASILSEKTDGCLLIDDLFVDQRIDCVAAIARSQADFKICKVLEGADEQRECSDDFSL